MLYSLCVGPKFEVETIPNDPRSSASLARGGLTSYLSFGFCFDTTGPFLPIFLAMVFSSL